MMKSIATNNRCRQIRAWLGAAISRRFGPEADWLQNHLSGCPRCQRRFAAYGKVNLALSLMKSQPHRLDLLMRANQQAVGVLKHSLRQAPKAQKLAATMPEPKLLERWCKYGHSTANLAACLAILFLMKVGVFSSMNEFQTQGHRVVRQYYTNQVGEELADEIFAQNTQQSPSANSRGPFTA